MHFVDFPQILEYDEHEDRYDAKAFFRPVQQVEKHDVDGKKVQVVNHKIDPVETPLIELIDLAKDGKDE